jgi:GT2 family glycosyltransferase
MQNKNHLISLIVCTMNRPRELKRLLQSLFNQSYKNYEIIVVDGSTNMKTFELVKKFHKKIKYVKQTGRGLPNARNLGLKFAKGSFIAFFDDDCIVHKDWIKEVISVFKRYKNVGGVCGKIKKMYSDRIKLGTLGKIMKFYANIFGISGFFVTLDGIGKVLETGFTTINFDKVLKDTETQWISGCDMCFSRNAIKVVKNFYEGFIGNAYYEDVDFSYRVYKSGFKLYCCPNAVVDHLVSKTNRKTLPKLKYYQLVNQKIFFYRNIYSGNFIQKLRFGLAHLALFVPVFLYSAYSCNLKLVASYLKAELYLKY